MQKDCGSFTHIYISIYKNREIGREDMIYLYFTWLNIFVSVKQHNIKFKDIQLPVFETQQFEGMEINELS